MFLYETYSVHMQRPDQLELHFKFHKQMGHSSRQSGKQFQKSDDIIRARTKSSINRNSWLKRNMTIPTSCSGGPEIGAACNPTNNSCRKSKNVRILKSTIVPILPVPLASPEPLPAPDKSHFSLLSEKENDDEHNLNAKDCFHLTAFHRDNSVGCARSIYSSLAHLDISSTKIIDLTLLLLENLAQCRVGGALYVIIPILLDLLYISSSRSENSSYQSLLHLQDNIVYFSLVYGSYNQYQLLSIPISQSRTGEH